MISELYVDETVRDYPAVDTVQQRLGIDCVTLIRDRDWLYRLQASRHDPIGHGKRVLFLTPNRGSFVKRCPGTKSYVCCGYHILNIGTYCTMDCAYCILQTYFHPPVLQYFVNHETLFEELDDLFDRKMPPFRRIGTGEFTDSLIWEPWTDISKALVARFARQDRIVLELKTKTCAVEGFRDIPHKRRTIMAWSVNPPPLISSEERGTASMSARLKAAVQCEAWGYPLAFHFDPLFLYDGCEEDYKRLVRTLFREVSAENIVWISIGSFRFTPSLKANIQKRFPQSKIVYGEFVPGLDGKMRYFKPLRVELYRKVIAWIKELAPDVVVYFCMEDEEVWHKCLGFSPQEYGGLPQMLDASAARHCGLDMPGITRCSYRAKT